MLRLAAAVLIFTTGCSAASTVSAPETACDPLAAHATTLATILGVGQDPAGVVYVADRGGVPTQPSVVRVFVVRGGTLIRQHVIGSGEIGTTEDIETFQSADGSSPPRDLDIQLDGDHATSLSIGAEGSGKSQVEGLDGGATTPLVLVDPASIQSLPAIDLPGSVNYVADSSDGRALVVVSPLEDDVGSSAVRLFYGTPIAMSERPIVSFDQSLSGYPSIGFTFDSQTLVMAISSLPPADGGLLNQPGPVTLTGAGQPVTFALRLPTPTTLTDFSFSCLTR